MTSRLKTIDSENPIASQAMSNIKLYLFEMIRASKQENVEIEGLGYLAYNILVGDVGQEANNKARIMGIEHAMRGVEPPFTWDDIRDLFNTHYPKPQPSILDRTPLLQPVAVVITHIERDYYNLARVTNLGSRLLFLIEER